jgi:hypothetical protein
MIPSSCFPDACLFIHIIREGVPHLKIYHMPSSMVSVDLALGVVLFQWVNSMYYVPWLPLGSQNEFEVVSTIL